MTPRFQRAEYALPPAEDAPAAPATQDETLELGPGQAYWGEAPTEAKRPGAEGRAVLGSGLALLAVIWIAYMAWAAGRAVSGEPLSSPAVAQWIAIAAGPLALLGLAWLMFGRTRRREAERFTQSVVAMQAEARSLEALLEVLSQRINDSRSELTMITQHLMQLGDDATSKFDGVTRQLDASSAKLLHHGEALDRAAESARTDIGVLLTDLPQAEATARAMTEQLRAAGETATGRAAEFERQVHALTERAAAADEQVGQSTQRLVGHLSEIESAGAAAAARVDEAESKLSTALGTLLERTAETLEQVRSGVDAQAAAVAALVEQASAGIGRAGVEAADSLGKNIDRAQTSLDSLSARVGEQDRASQRLFADIDRGLSLIDERFAQLAAQGDERANHFLGSLGRARAELDALAAQASSQDSSIAGLAERTEALRETLDRLSTEVREGLIEAIGEAQGGAERLREAAETAKPEIGWMRDAATEASSRLEECSTGIAEQQDRLAALLAALDDGVGDAGQKLGVLASAIAETQQEAARLTAEAAPALVEAMVQVRETAQQAAERAREAIAKVIPESSNALSQATREALEAAIRESVEERLREVQTLAARAVDSAREASDRLTQQMLSLGQSASALDQHFQQKEADQRAKDSEAFARRVALLIDSMHSAAIDVGKILSDEVDDKAWASYLKGNRGVFTRRAVQLIGGSESRALRAHYESDAEFQASVNRYVHDFEAMLRRVLAERDGGTIAVTLMSSDMGKLYAALAQAIERRR